MLTESENTSNRSAAADTALTSQKNLSSSSVSNGSLTSTRATVRFFSKQPKYASLVNNAPSLMIPSQVKRSALSEILHHLLGHEKPESESLFDFLIDGVMLRVSLAAFIEKRGISPESLIAIEFQDALPRPTATEQFMHSDWVSCIAYHPSKDWLLTGCFDNEIRLFQTGDTRHHALHDDTVKDIAFLDHSKVINAKDGFDYFISASQDKTLGLWRTPSSGKKGAGIQQVSSFQGHSSCVKGLGVCPNQPAVASGSWDMTVKIWRISEAPEEEKILEEDKECIAAVSKRSKSKKKQKTVNSTREIHKADDAIATMKGHTAPISATLWTQSTGIIASASWDHTVRLWNPITAQSVATLKGDYAANALAENGNLIAAGFSDYHLALYDTRTLSTPCTKLVMTQPNPWIYSLSWSPASEYQLCSVSADGVIRVWDIRSSVPLHLLPLEDKRPDLPKDAKVEVKKVLAVCWARERIIFAGGENESCHKFEIL